MNKQTYLSGLLECESLRREGYTLGQLKSFLDQEATLVDYRLDKWCEGFLGGIEHFIRLEQLKL